MLDCVCAFVCICDENMLEWCRYLWNLCAGILLFTKKCLEVGFTVHRGTFGLLWESLWLVHGKFFFTTLHFSAHPICTNTVSGFCSLLVFLFPDPKSCPSLPLLRHPLFYPLSQSWLVRNSTVYGMKLPTRFQLIGQIHLADYEKWISVFSQKKHSTYKSESFTSRTYARYGICVAPSVRMHDLVAWCVLYNTVGLVSIARIY